MTSRPQFARALRDFTIQVRIGQTWTFRTMKERDDFVAEQNARNPGRVAPVHGMAAILEDNTCPART